MASLSTRTQPLTAAPTEPVGGLLALEAPDELALGDADDWSEELEMFEDDDSEEVGMRLSIGVSTLSIHTSSESASADLWDAGDIQELVVNETQGDFRGDADGRNDAVVMEDDFDLEDEVIFAVWANDSGRIDVGRRVRRANHNPALVPYWFVGGGLAVGAVVALAGIALVLLVALFAAPKREVVPLDPATLPKVEIAVPEASEDKTADEILKEVLGEE